MTSMLANQYRFVVRAIKSYQTGTFIQKSSNFPSPAYKKRKTKSKVTVLNCFFNRNNGRKQLLYYLYPFNNHCTNNNNKK